MSSFHMMKIHRGANLETFQDTHRPEVVASVCGGSEQRKLVNVIFKIYETEKRYPDLTRKPCQGPKLLSSCCGLMELLGTLLSKFCLSIVTLYHCFLHFNLLIVVLSEDRGFYVMLRNPCCHLSCTLAIKSNIFKRNRTTWRCVTVNIKARTSAVERFMERRRQNNREAPAAVQRDIIQNLSKHHELSDPLDLLIFNNFEPIEHHYIILTTYILYEMIPLEKISYSQVTLLKDATTLTILVYVCWSLGSAQEHGHHNISAWLFGQAQGIVPLGNHSKTEKTILDIQRGSEDTSHHKVLCLRIRTRSGVKDAQHSIIFEVDLGGPFTSAVMPTCIGWEKNERGKLGPRMLNLSASMDPTRLAESAVDLNLKLMRWRVAPDLDLDVIRATRCLLLGAGTLGCAVARVLMGWGVQNITFVDSGKISFSNPVRQNLFTFEDCLDGGRHKAMAAAEALKKIFPKVNSRGVVVSIPMPGHSVGESLVQSITSDVATLEQLVEEHDVIFLLTDSRESRWLPTLLGAAKNKHSTTYSFGDMRRGDKGRSDFRKKKIQNIFKQIFSCILGGAKATQKKQIYISQRRRLLFSCIILENSVCYPHTGSWGQLNTICLTERESGGACAGVSGTEGLTEGVLGPVPHTIRGFLSQHQQLTPATVEFSQCSACSQKVVSTYKSEGIEFLLKVFNSPSYLEELTGLSKLHQDTDADQV
ncbi:unnamed protein product, partial [Meganyctiphanes norvegica]